MRRIVCLIFLAVACSICASVWADEPVKITGDTIWGDTQKKHAYLEGNVRIVQGTTIITTTSAEIDLDKKQVFLKKQVKLTHPEATIVADALDYDLKKKTGTFKQNVVMERIEVKDSQGKTAKDPFKLTCKELYFESDSKNFVAKYQCQIIHHDFTGTAETIEYSDKLQEMLLSEHAYLKKTEGEEIWGDQVKLNLQDRSFVVEKNVSLNFNVDDEDDKKNPSQK